jgi:hypothetical protein
MGEEVEDTVAPSAAELEAMGCVIEEEDETGAPEKVAWPIVVDEDRLVSDEESADA